MPSLTPKLAKGLGALDGAAAGPAALSPADRAVLAGPPAPPAASAQLSATLTEEQNAVEAGTAAARRLLAERPALAKAFAGMVTARQLYVVAFREIEHVLTKEADVPPLAKEVLVFSAMRRAAQPFSEHTAVKAVVETLLPWLAEVVDRHSDADAEARRAAEDEAHKARLAEDVPVGFAWAIPTADGADAATAVPRRRSLVLVGDRRATLYLLDRAQAAAVAAGLTVARFAATPPKRGDAHAQVARVGPSAWEGCANTRQRPAAVFAAHLLEKVSRPPDVLLVEDLPRCFTAGFAGRPAAANAGDAHARLREVCDKLGTAIVAAVAGTPDDIKAAPFEQLRAFADVVPVAATASADDGALTAVVGRSASVHAVPADYGAPAKEVVLP